MADVVVSSVAVEAAFDEALSEVGSVAAEEPDDAELPVLRHVNELVHEGVDVRLAIGVRVDEDVDIERDRVRRRAGLRDDPTAEPEVGHARDAVPDPLPVIRVLERVLAGELAPLVGNREVLGLPPVVRDERLPDALLEGDFETGRHEVRDAEALKHLRRRLVAGRPLETERHRGCRRGGAQRCSVVVLLVLLAVPHVLAHEPTLPRAWHGVSGRSRARTADLRLVGQAGTLYEVDGNQRRSRRAALRRRRAGRCCTRGVAAANSGALPVLPPSRTCR